MAFSCPLVAVVIILIPVIELVVLVVSVTENMPLTDGLIDAMFEGGEVALLVGWLPIGVSGLTMD